MSALDRVMLRAVEKDPDAFEADLELARLRRMADAYAKGAESQDRYRGKVCGCCDRCTDNVLDRAPLREVIHAATCDVAIHLGLPREKGEGDGA